MTVDWTSRPGNASRADTGSGAGSVTGTEDVAAGTNAGAAVVPAILEVTDRAPGAVGAPATAGTCANVGSVAPPTGAVAGAVAGFGALADALGDPPKAAVAGSDDADVSTASGVDEVAVETVGSGTAGVDGCCVGTDVGAEVPVVAAGAVLSLSAPWVIADGVVAVDVTGAGSEDVVEVSATAVPPPAAHAPATTTALPANLAARTQFRLILIDVLHLAAVTATASNDGVS